MSNGIHIVGQRSRPRSKAPQEGPLWFPIPRLNVMAHPASLEVDVRRDDLRAGESQAATGVLVPRSDDFAHVGTTPSGRPPESDAVDGDRPPLLLGEGEAVMETFLPGAATPRRPMWAAIRVTLELW